MHPGDRDATRGSRASSSSASPLGAVDLDYRRQMLRMLTHRSLTRAITTRFGFDDAKAATMAEHCLLGWAQGHGAVLPATRLECGALAGSPVRSSRSPIVPSVSGVGTRAAPPPPRGRIVPSVTSAEPAPDRESVSPIVPSAATRKAP